MAPLLSPCDLALPVIAAPMAGGPSTPELAAAVSGAGGLGFLAAAYLDVDTLASRWSAATAATDAPLGVNVFVPQRSVAEAAALQRYARELAGVADRLAVATGEPRYDDDGWAAKLEALLDLRPAVASFTFGLPTAGTVAALRSAGVAVWATVTSSTEADAALARDVDALVVQGPDAGGHRGTFDPGAPPGTAPLDDLLRDLRRYGVPLIAAGGLVGPADAQRVRDAGATAVAAGTAFLLSDEAGTSAVHRAALRDAAFTETVVTAAFSGRYARALRNRFVDDHAAHAPLGYPEVHHLTSPVRAAAARAGDPHDTHLWAGTGFARISTGPAADIARGLADELVGPGVGRG